MSTTSITRRHLTALFAGGAATLAIRPAFAVAKGAPGKGKGGVLFGVQSYSFRDRSLDEAIDAMVQVGLKTCELWQGHVEPKSASREDKRKFRLETPLSTWKDVGAKFKKAGISLCAYNYSFKDDFTDEEIARGFEMAKALGAPAITASANQSVVARVAPLAKKHKIKVAMHNHSKKDPNEFATPEDFAKAMEGKDRQFIAVNLDIGHFTAADFDAVDYLKKNHRHIVTLHIKDRKKNQGENLPFGQGDTPIKDVLLAVRDNKWKIPANIEYEYKGADTIEEMKKCLAYCQAIVDG
jgi:sugar phosphate isomerase/epimerase